MIQLSHGIWGETMEINMEQISPGIHIEKFGGYYVAHKAPRPDADGNEQLLVDLVQEAIPDARIISCEIQDDLLEVVTFTMGSAEEEYSSLKISYWSTDIGFIRLLEQPNRTHGHSTIPAEMEQFMQEIEREDAFAINGAQAPPASACPAGVCVGKPTVSAAEKANRVRRYNDRLAHELQHLLAAMSSRQ